MSMEKEQLADEFRNFFALVTDLRQERGDLKLKIHLARCGIQKEWEKSESKWKSLQAASNHSPDTARQLARELKDIYIRIYRGLLVKSSNLLRQLDAIGQAAKPEDTTQLKTLKIQVADEVVAIRLKLENLGTELQRKNLFALVSNVSKKPASSHSTWIRFLECEKLKLKFIPAGTIAPAAMPVCISLDSIPADCAASTRLFHARPGDPPTGWRSIHHLRPAPQAAHPVANGKSSHGPP
jgi:hypothetical protein